MKNVTIAIDDDTHRAARIRAAELGTSLSALVKGYLQELAGGAAPIFSGVKEMAATFKHAPVEVKSEGPPWFIGGKWVYTPDGKPRQPGALRHLPPLPDDFDEWTPEVDDMFADVFKPWNDDDFDPLP